MEQTVFCCYHGNTEKDVISLRKKEKVNLGILVCLREAREVGRRKTQEECKERDKPIRWIVVNKESET